VEDPVRPGADNGAGGGQAPKMDEPRATPGAADAAAPGPTDAGPSEQPAACAYVRESLAGKLTEPLIFAFAKNPGPRRVFIQYKRHPVITPLPGCESSGGRPPCPEREAAIAAIEQMVDEIQRCVVMRLPMIGGEFLERFWLGNSTLARLDYAQALDIAGLTDVRQLDDADAPGPPPP
jgi:hypothetical protein